MLVMQDGLWRERNFGEVGSQMRGCTYGIGNRLFEACNANGKLVHPDYAKHMKNIMPSRVTSAEMSNEELATILTLVKDNRETVKDYCAL